MLLEVYAYKQVTNEASELTNEAREQTNEARKRTSAQLN